MLTNEETQIQTTAVVDYGLVSIIMPNYNSEKYVRATIQSVLDQTYQNWELIFVDDCSTDSSLEIVKSFGDDRIKVFQNETNSGAAVSRNYALRMAQGKWMAFLDSDDLWIPEKLEKQLAFMVENDIHFSYSDYEVIDEDNKVMSTFRPRLEVCKYEDILKHNHIGCLTAIYNAEKLGKVLMPVEAIKREDLACWLDILKTGVTAHCLHECLAKYKVHSNSVSSNKFKMMKYQWNVYRNLEKLSILKCVYYMASWTIQGILKYR